MNGHTMNGRWSIGNGDVSKVCSNFCHLILCFALDPFEGLQLQEIKLS